MANDQKKPSHYEQMLAIEEFKQNMPHLIELQEHIATVRMKSFEAHMKAGFTPEQAVILCQKVTL